MSKHKLGDLLRTISRSSSNSSIQLTSVLDTPPLLTMTLLGTEPGKAAFDTPPPPAKGANKIRGADFFRKIKGSHFNPGTILKDNALKLKDGSKSSPASEDDTDGRQSARTVGSGASSVSGLPSVTPAPRPGWDSDHATTSGRGARTGGAGEGITGGATTGADNAMSAGARTSKAADGCTHTHTAHWGPTPAPATPNQEPEYRHLIEGEHTQRSDYIESLDPTALAAHLGQYITYEPRNSPRKTSRHSSKPTLRIIRHPWHLQNSKLQYVLKGPPGRLSTPLRLPRVHHRSALKSPLRK
ncbi:hypothetical protein FRC06_011718 [Ceratobasidium sp. 370]|nr:hypothetical protein FRC06_011718 [Ceratobasidium sp. 370]